MARYRATCKGNGGEASRLGQNRIETNANGWDLGVTVIGMRYKEQDGFHIYATRGSSDRKEARLLGTLRLDDAGDFVFTPNVIEQEA